MNVFFNLIDILFNTKTKIKVLLSNSTKMNVFLKLIDILFNTKTTIKVLLTNIKMVTARAVFRNLSWGTYIFFSPGGEAQELFEPITSLKTKDFTDKGKWGLSCRSPPPGYVSAKNLTNYVHYILIIF